QELAPSLTLSDVSLLVHKRFTDNACQRTSGNADIRHPTPILSFVPATLLPRGKSAYVFSLFVPEILSGQLRNTIAFVLRKLTSSSPFWHA
ncbi:hypothetical protein KAX17_17820, partial [Candidatus Bipolaricaulota bacterium]|nr:hypothetical protein [Candidatus Bipolaricaulota bacterium]